MFFAPPTDSQVHVLYSLLKDFVQPVQAPVKIQRRNSIMHKKRKSSIMSLKAVSQETKAKPLAKTKPLETTDAKVNNNEKVNNNDNPAITPDVAASNAVTPEGTSTSVEVEGKQAEAQAETDEKQTENEPEEEGVSEGDEEYEDKGSIFDD